MTCTFSTHRSKAFSPVLSVLNTHQGALAEKQESTTDTHKNTQELTVFDAATHNTLGYQYLLYAHTHTYARTDLSVS